MSLWTCQDETDLTPVERSFPVLQTSTKDVGSPLWKLPMDASELEKSWVFAHQNQAFSDKFRRRPCLTDENSSEWILKGFFESY